MLLQVFELQCLSSIQAEILELKLQFADGLLTIVWAPSFHMGNNDKMFSFCFSAISPSFITWWNTHRVFSVISQNTPILNYVLEMLENRCRHIRLLFFAYSMRYASMYIWHFVNSDPKMLIHIAYFLFFILLSHMCASVCIATWNV